MEHIGKVILARTLELGMTKAQFGRLINVNHRQNIQRIFEKKEFTLEELKRFEKILDIDLVSRFYINNQSSINKLTEGSCKTISFPSITVHLDGSMELLEKNIKMLTQMNEIIRTNYE